MASFIQSPCFYIGTSGWTYPHWQGRFYPPGLPASRRFAFYAQHFNAVEINATFYRTFKEPTYRKWAAQAPEGFRYVLKAPKTITHRKYLEDAEEDIRAFRTSAEFLEDKLGVILLQLAPSTPYDPSRLRRALLAFGDPSRIVVEFRHPRWLTEETRALLADLGAVFCEADSPKSRPLGWVTARTAYFRLHGRSHWYYHNYTQEELHEIADWIRRATRQGAQTVYVFFNNDFEAFAPFNALALQKILSGAGLTPAPSQ
ncbi:DUF72 domain-containing protein [uncultured Thermanaerothrix sp.]|uniref:DUF72 domain-containing protein n=1 Tax=uncultured Thermanaerothrix sp. TaxID=1195149 RepID=UPI0026094090|nr:DUF72 domain-containing protein [uncultured Thermanaerothrix sp.]